jgi:shikimate kinase
LLKATGIAVWLRAHPETIWSRLQQDVSTQVRRPPLTTLAGVEEVNELLHVREPLYKECADFEVDTTRKTPQEVAEEALGFLLPAFRDM